MCGIVPFAEQNDCELSSPSLRHVVGPLEVGHVPGLHYAKPITHNTPMHTFGSTRQQLSSFGRCADLHVAETAIAKVVFYPIS
eukprot:COSAG06_NODE_5961_length_3182_cov_85.789491_3_plen_83_part_00